MIKGEDLIASEQFYNALRWISSTKRQHFQIVQAYSLVAIQETLDKILAIMEGKQYKTKDIEKRKRETPEATNARVEADVAIRETLVEAVEEVIPETVEPVVVEILDEQTVAEEELPEEVVEEVVEEVKPKRRKRIERKTDA